MSTGVIYMNDFSLLSIAAKNVRRKPMRTAMLAVSIGLLASIIVFALSFIHRVRQGVGLMSARLGADVLVVPTGSRGSAEEVLLENQAKSFYMDRGVVERVSRIEGVERVTYQTYLVTLSGMCCSVPESMVIAFNQDTDFIVRPWLSGGRDMRLGRGEAFVGHESAFNINLGLVEVDGMLFGSVFKMKGVLEKTGTGLDNAIFISDEGMSDIIKNGRAPVRSGQISIVFVKVAEGRDPGKVAAAIENSIIEVDAVARGDIGSGIISTLKDVSGVFSGTIIIASILSIFLAWTVFSAVANERAREVGIMRAVGAKGRHIMRLFMTEVILIGAVGGIAGAGCGTMLSISLGSGFKLLRNLPTDLAGMERLAIAFIGLVIGTLVCLVGALAPIQRLKKMEPIMVIKEE